MDAPHYGSVYVSSAFHYYWMTYYIHHSDMDIPHYVLVDVSSD